MAQEFPRIAIGLIHEGGAGLVAQHFEILVDQRSFAHAGFGDQRKKATIVGSPHQQGSESFTMLCAHVQESRIGSVAEWRFGEFVKVEDHQAACLGTEARTGMSRASVTSFGVRKEESKYSAANAEKTAANDAKINPTAMTINGP